MSDQPSSSSSAQPAEGEKGPSKSQLKKMEQQKKKEDAKLARAKQREDEKQQQSSSSASSAASEPGSENFVPLGINMSQKREGKTFSKVCDLTPALEGQEVLLQARVHTVRGKGNVVFLLLRQGISSVQAVVRTGDRVPKSAVRFVSGLTCESLVEVAGTVRKASVEKATQHEVELHLSKCFLVSAAETPLPLQLEDAARPQPVIKAMRRELEAIERERQALVTGKTEAELGASPLKEQLEALEERKKKATFVKPGQETRLNNRVLDLRTPANQAIFRLQSATCQLFREYLLERGFIEIHTPKLIGGASEGGSNVFKVQYFETSAFLAQSPQLYKQMAITADLDRVFEIGPVFRAENANTRRHLTEFVGLDLEMAFREHYHEVLETLEGLFLYVLKGLLTRYAAEVASVGQQYPIEPLIVEPVKRLKFSEAVEMLVADGQQMGPFDDFSTPLEIRLGQLVRAKYNTDLYVVDKFPAAVRPFYTMPDPQSPGYSNSYDVFLRGQEICSGAQRIHDPALLTTRAKEKGVTPESIRAYIDSFRWGAPPHAGAGIGLERIVMLFLGLGNIRKTSMFPRDPVRLLP